MDVDNRYTPSFLTERLTATKKYAKVSKLKGSSLDNIDKSRYDPFALKAGHTSVKYDDPAYRTQKIAA